MRFASRKFVVVLLSLGATCALAYLDKLSAGAATVISSLAALYSAANVGQKAIK